jgi:hypothetical protein
MALHKATFAKGLHFGGATTQAAIKCQTRRQRKVVRDSSRPKRLLLKDKAFRHILPNNCNYPSSMPQIQRS